MAATYAPASPPLEYQLHSISLEIYGIPRRCCEASAPAQTFGSRVLSGILWIELNPFWIDFDEMALEHCRSPFVDARHSRETMRSITCRDFLRGEEYHADCIRRIFTERLPAFVLPWARLTVRPCEALQSVGLATCGELGTRLAERLAMQTSPTTILRRLMALPTATRKQVTELGVDDFCATRSYARSCKDSRKEALTWSSASSALPG